MNVVFSFVQRYQTSGALTSKCLSSFEDVQTTYPCSEIATPFTLSMLLHVSFKPPGILAQESID